MSDYVSLKTDTIYIVFTNK